MDELLRLARADLDCLGQIELVGAAAFQQKLVHHGQDVGLDAHHRQAADLAIMPLRRLVAKP